MSKQVQPPSQDDQVRKAQHAENGSGTGSGGKLEQASRKQQDAGRMIRSIILQEDPDAAAEKICQYFSDELGQERARLEVVIAAARVGTWQWNLRTNQIHLNEIWAELLGYRLEDLQPLTLETWRRLVHKEDLPWVERLLQSCCLSPSEEYSATYRMYHRDGHIVWILDRGRVMTRDTEGNPLLMFGTHTDVSENKAAEEVLRESEAYHRALVQNTADAFWILDREARFIDVNQAFCRLLNYEAEQLLKMSIYDVEGRETKREVGEHLKLIRQGGSHSFRTLLLDSDNQPLPVELTVSYLDSGEGSYIVFGRDLRKREHQEEHIALLGHMLDAAPVSITVYNYDGDYLYANNHAIRMHGCHSIEEFRDIKKQLLSDSAYCEILKQRLDSVRGQGEARYEIEHLRRDGSRIILEAQAKEILWEGERAVLSIATDVSQQKRAREALEKRLIALTQPIETDAELGFRDLFNLDDLQRIQDEFANATKVASMITLPDGTPLTKPSNFVHLCANLVRQTPKGAENCRKSDSYLGRYHPEGPVAAPCASCGLWDAGVSITVGGRHVANWLIGQVRDCTQSEETIRVYAREIGMDEEEAVTAFRQVPEMSRERFDHIARLLYTIANRLSDMAYQNAQQTRFIQQRRDAEDELRLSEERFRILLNETPVVSVQGYHPDGTVVFWNEGARRLYGYTQEQALGRSLFDLILPEEMHREARIAMARMANNGEAEPASEMELLHRDGHRVAVFSTHCTVRRPGRPVELYCVDIDLRQIRQAEEEREQLREQLIQAQKMESIGRLAGGVAHDFNNLLSVILGNSEFLLDDLPEDSEFREGIEEIQQAAKRSADLTRQLLAFARKQTVSPRMLDLNETVESMLKMLERLLGENISLVWKPAIVSHPIFMDPAQIDQLLANLCVNARDAVDASEGQIVIHSASCSFSEADCRRDKELKPGHFMLLEVSDNGCGMDSETLENIFEPFFTTKGMAEGTGLGLATVFGIVQQNGGFLRVNSQPGEGSCFQIYLPALEMEEHLPQARVTSARSTGKETVLLVEDESVILDLGMRMLRRLGYKVLAANSPRQAIELAQNSESPIELVISDVVMPGMNGRQLVDQLCKMHPDLKVVFMSGYPADLITQKGMLHEHVVFLQKPFTQDQLASRLREALDG